MNKRLFGQRFVTLFLVAALTLSWIGTASAQRPRSRYGARPAVDGTVPEGTVISVRMDATLSSKSAHVGDRFTATVAIPVYVNGAMVIPSGATVEGHISQVTPARRMGRSGVIAVEFDNLVLPDGTRIGLDGTLTSDDAEIRRQIDDENRVSGRDNRRTGVFVGSGGIMGAVLGGIAGGAKGAAVGGAVGAGVGLASVLLSKGEEARVPGGMPFGVQLRRALSIHTGATSDPVASANPGDNPNSDPPDPGKASDPAMRQPEESRSEPQPIENRQPREPADVEADRQPAETGSSRQPVSVPSSRQPDTPNSRESVNEPDDIGAPVATKPSAPVESLPLTAPEMTRRAQTALRDEGYYEGEITDQWSPRAIKSMKTYQREHKLPESGALDAPTAKSLGITNSQPVNQSEKVSSPPSVTVPVARDTILATILSATATRLNEGGIYILINVQANTGGWRWYGDHVVNGDTLEVFARAIRPTGTVTQVITRGKIELNVSEGVEYVRRVVVHSNGADQVIALGRGVATSSPNNERASTPVEDSLTPLAISIQSKASDLLAEHKRQLGMSSSGDRRDDGGRTVYSDADVELLFALNSFANAANLYAGLIGNLQDSQSRRQATLDLARQARRTDRIIAVSTSRDASFLLPRWDNLRQDILRLMRMFNISTSEIEN